MKHVARFGALVMAGLLAAGCTFGDPITDFNGVPDHEGNQVSHLNQTKLALNLLLFTPLWGDATLESNVRDVAAAAQAEGANGVRIVQSSDSLWWWCLPPFSFILTPHWSNVAADLVHRS